MRICVIGNSHAGALKTAHSEALANPATWSDWLHLDFYVLPGATQPKLRLRDGRLSPVEPGIQAFTTIPGADQEGVEIATFDGLVLSACGSAAARNKYIEARRSSHPLGGFACADWPPANSAAAHELLSPDEFCSLVGRTVQGHPASRVALQLAREFTGPVLLQPWPAPGRVRKTDSEWFVNATFGPNGPRAWFAFFQAQHCALRELVEELGPRFSLLDYPLPEVLADGFMDSAWCHRRDPWHANTRYGRLVLDQIVAGFAARR